MICPCSCSPLLSPSEAPGERADAALCFRCCSSLSSLVFSAFASLDEKVQEFKGAEHAAFFIYTYRYDYKEILFVVSTPQLSAYERYRYKSACSTQTVGIFGWGGKPRKMPPNKNVHIIDTRALRGFERQ